MHEYACACVCEQVPEYGTCQTCANSLTLWVVIFCGITCCFLLLRVECASQSWWSEFLTLSMLSTENTAD